MKNAAPSEIHRMMRVIDVVTLCPAGIDVLSEWGLHCASCAMGGLESLEEGCRAHGYGDDDIQLLLQDLNEAMRSAPQRPMDIEVTASAARAIRSVGEQEGKTAFGLAVIVDGAGGFCMEFRDAPEEGDRSFLNAEEPDVHIYASPLTLARIGGATIDFREGRFKLDLPEEDCGCTPSSCSCEKEGV